MGTRFATLVSDNDAGTRIFKQENLFSIVMLVKRDRLIGRQGLGKYKEIFGLAELAIDLNCERNASERARPVYQPIAVIFLEDQWGGRLQCLFPIRNPLLTVLLPPDLSRRLLLPPHQSRLATGCFAANDPPLESSRWPVYRDFVSYALLGDLNAAHNSVFGRITGDAEVVGTVFARSLRKRQLCSPAPQHNGNVGRYWVDFPSGGDHHV